MFMTASRQEVPSRRRGRRPVAIRRAEVGYPWSANLPHSARHGHRLSSHPLRSGRLPAHPTQPLALRRQDALRASAGGRPPRGAAPAPAVRQVVLGVAAGELLQPCLGRRLRGGVRRHRPRARAHRRAPPLRGAALQLLRVQQRTAHPGAPLRGVLRAGSPRRPGAQSGPVPGAGVPAHPRSARHRRKAHRAVPPRQRPRYPAVHAHRRVRQLRQHRARPSRRGGVSRLHPRRGLLPQLLRHGEGGDGAKWRGAGAPLHHRGLPDHPRRCDERLQHRGGPEPGCGLQRDAGVHGGGGARGGGDVPGPAARSTRTWTRRSR